MYFPFCGLGYNYRGKMCRIKKGPNGQTREYENIAATCSKSSFNFDSASPFVLLFLPFLGVRDTVRKRELQKKKKTNFILRRDLSLI